MLAALYALMQFLFAPLIGSVSDRYGRRPVILISLLGSAIDYFLIAFAPNLIWFAVGRIVAGITAANYAAAAAYIADVSPPEKRAANFGLIGAAFGIGFIIGPIVGGGLAAWGVKVPFFVAGGLTLINWVYGWFVLPESLALENRRAFSWSRSNPVGALFALHRFPALMGLVTCYFIAVLAHQVYPSIWVLYTTYRYGWTELQTGLSLAAVGVMAGMVQGGLTKRVVGWLGEQKTVRYCLTLSIFLYAAYGLATQPWMIYLCIVIGSLSGLVTPAVQSLMSQGVPADEQGALQGSLSSLSSVAGIAGPLLCTQLFGFFIGEKAPAILPGAPFFLSSAMMMIALFIAVPALKRITLIK
jgi:DHA1 family tetracycline resistance protein-like MFS transporter